MPNVAVSVVGLYTSARRYRANQLQWRAGLVHKFLWRWRLVSVATVPYRSSIRGFELPSASFRLFQRV